MATATTGPSIAPTTARRDTSAVGAPASAAPATVAAGVLHPEWHTLRLLGSGRRKAATEAAPEL